MRTEIMKGLLATSFGAVLVAGAILARPAVAQDDFPAGPGKDILVNSCNGCHSAEQVTSEQQTKEQWASTVATMVGNGAIVPEGQMDTLVSYLAEHWGPAGAAAAPAAGATMPPAGGTAPAPAAPADAAAPAPAAPAPAAPADAAAPAPAAPAAPQ